MFKIDSVNKRELDAFHSDIASIKQYLCEVGNTYLLIAFRIYEMYRNGNYKKYYKTIVEACQAELGFKKSTTYNMINIVKRFGRPDTYGSISYQTFVNLDYSYSQLCEMLSLSDKQLESVSPQTTVKELREMKKVQTSGKIENEKEVIDVPADFIISEEGIEEIEETSEPLEAVDVSSESCENNFEDIRNKYSSDVFPILLPLSTAESIALTRFLNLHNTSKSSDFYVLSQISQRLKILRR